MLELSFNSRSYDAEIIKSIGAEKVLIEEIEVKAKPLHAFRFESKNGRPNIDQALTLTIANMIPSHKQFLAFFGSSSLKIK